jgi:hypothetical protein
LKDVCQLGVIKVEEGGDWCRDIMVKKVGNGEVTRFWHDIWISSSSLCQAFPRLGITTKGRSYIIRMGEWNNVWWYWDLKWRRKLFVWEKEHLMEMMGLLGEANLTRVADSWICNIGDVDEGYVVKEGYGFLSDNFLPPSELNDSDCLVMKRLWDSMALSKVIIFTWQLMFQCLPTRVNLSRMGVLTPQADLHCVWCSSEPESETHLFTMCRVAVQVPLYREKQL